MQPLGTIPTPADLRTLLPHGAISSIARSLKMPHAAVSKALQKAKPAHLAVAHDIRLIKESGSQTVQQDLAQLASPSSGPN
ncbi:hypothetical protein [Hymenobacter sedentarius]|uniref:hypothetical protein n=1 Tax=Hymenobacter sedentarius TaxID=1411621 RepID=UPI000ADEE5F5|nr:hypothetical protein [Hymenobacter sedentarius]